ncbi:MAG TPA: putative metal-dependent hydrolase [Terriglobia bacterium]|nr:putative metal-dependent hydrolase [Terriglobia bacterium]
MTTTDLRYPIGEYAGERMSAANRSRILLEISELPGRLRDAIEGLGDRQLDTVYRPGGWTVRQVVHHVADSHLNSYLRTRFALTLNEPTIMAYDENLWAALKDAQSGPVDPSLLILEGIHARWCELLESLSEAEWAKRFVHPERGIVVLNENIPLYAWHGRHHTAHITELRKRMGW